MDKQFWQLMNALNTAARNLTEEVAISAWPGWIRFLLEQMDTHCQDNGYDGDAMLRAVREVIDGRLQAGRW